VREEASPDRHASAVSDGHAHSLSPCPFIALAYTEQTAIFCLSEAPAHLAIDVFPSNNSKVAVRKLGVATTAPSQEPHIGQAVYQELRGRGVRAWHLMAVCDSLHALFRIGRGFQSLFGWINGHGIFPPRVLVSKEGVSSRQAQ
jgi:hypothetical protein